MGIFPRSCHSDDKVVIMIADMPCLVSFSMNFSGESISEDEKFNFLDIRKMSVNSRKGFNYYVSCCSGSQKT